LEDGGSQDDKVPRRMWETVEAGIREIVVGKTERRRSKRRSGKKKETEKGKNSGSKESSRRVGDIG